MPSHHARMQKQRDEEIRQKQKAPNNQNISKQTRKNIKLVEQKQIPFCHKCYILHGIQIPFNETCENCHNPNCSLVNIHKFHDHFCYRCGLTNHTDAFCRAQFDKKIRCKNCYCAGRNHFTHPESKCWYKTDEQKLLDSAAIAVAAVVALTDNNETLQQQTQQKKVVKIDCGSASLQGYRPTQEDYHFCELFPNGISQGVNDGHAGHQVSEIVNNQLSNLMKSIQGDLDKIDPIEEWQKIDQKLKMVCPTSNECGSCSIVLNVIHKNNYFHATAVNFGDSRALIGKLASSSVTRLGRDHHPTTEEEVKKIVQAGGICYGGRVGGILAVSRAFGDFSLKGLIKTPEVHKADPIPDSETIIAITACDGFFENCWSHKCFTDKTIWDFVLKKIAENPEKNLDWIAEETAKEALAMGSRDNLTLCISKIFLTDS